MESFDLSCKLSDLKFISKEVDRPNLLCVSRVYYKYIVIIVTRIKQENQTLGKFI